MKIESQWSHAQRKFIDIRKRLENNRLTILIRVLFIAFRTASAQKNTQTFSFDGMACAFSSFALLMLGYLVWKHVHRFDIMIRQQACVQYVYKNVLPPSRAHKLYGFGTTQQASIQNIPQTTILYFDGISISAFNIIPWLRLYAHEFFNRFCSIFAYFGRKSSPCRLTNPLETLKIQRFRKRTTQKKWERKRDAEKANGSKLETGCHITVWK